MWVLRTEPGSSKSRKCSCPLRPLSSPHIIKLMMDLIRSYCLPTLKTEKLMTIKQLAEVGQEQRKHIRVLQRNKTKRTKQMQTHKKRQRKNRWNAGDRNICYEEFDLHDYGVNDPDSTGLPRNSGESWCFSLVSEVHQAESQNSGSAPWSSLTTHSYKYLLSFSL